MCLSQQNLPFSCLFTVSFHSLNKFRDLVFEQITNYFWGNAALMNTSKYQKAVADPFQARILRNLLKLIIGIKQNSRLTALTPCAKCWHTIRHITAASVTHTHDPEMTIKQSKLYVMYCLGGAKNVILFKFPIKNY